MEQMVGLSPRDDHKTRALADWRRRMNALYAAVRAEQNPEAAWSLWRDGRNQMFHDHPQSPIAVERRTTYKEIPLYDYDPSWRLLVATEPMVDEHALAADGGNDGTIRMHTFARTLGLRDKLGQELTLYWIDGYGGGIFLPFKDTTAGSETYLGGRYLLDGIKGADLGETRDGRMVLDFNFCYHPSCCHSPAWVCPLAPVENHVRTAIRAGEKL